MSDNQEDKNFNDNELQDIMDEIESLEKEFVEEETSEVVEVAEQVEASALIEEEVEPAQEAPVMASEESAPEESPVEENIVEISSAAQVPEEGQMNFQGSGNMNFQMSFQLGGETAELKVSQEGGLQVFMKGVELSLDNSGCQVEMGGGVKFSVPFDATASKAKAA